MNHAASVRPRAAAARRWWSRALAGAMLAAGVLAAGLQPGTAVAAAGTRQPRCAGRGCPGALPPVRRQSICTPRADIVPPFHVAGLAIDMADGRPFVPCGSTIAAPHGSPSGWQAQLARDERAIARMVGFWGVNTVRIMAWEKWLNDPDTTSSYLSYLAAEIAYVRSLHAAVLLQAFTVAGCVPTAPEKKCHAPRNARNPGQGTVQFWQTIKTGLPGLGRSGTLLDLYNEPNYPGRTDRWRLWEQGNGGAIVGFQQIADTLAGTGDVLIVEGPVVAQTLAQVTPSGYHITAPAGTGGIAYGIHHPSNAWLARNPRQLRRILDIDLGRTAGHYPVIFTEWSGFSSNQTARGKGSGTCWPRAGRQPLYQTFMRYIGHREGCSLGLVVYGTAAWQDRLETLSGRLTRITPRFRCLVHGMHPQEGAGRLVWNYFHGKLPD